MNKNKNRKNEKIEMKKNKTDLWRRREGTTSASGYEEYEESEKEQGERSGLQRARKRPGQRPGTD